MKIPVLTVYYIFIIVFSAHAQPFAAFLVDEATSHQIARRVRAQIDPLIKLALENPSHSPEVQDLKLTHATLTSAPQILDFSVRKKEEGLSSDDVSRTDLHMSVHLTHMHSETLQRDLLTAASLVRRCPIHAVGITTLGRRIALSLNINTSHLPEEEAAFVKKAHKKPSYFNCKN